MSSVQAANLPTKLISVQVLRAFAALMVVSGHVLGAAEKHPDRFGEIQHIRYAGGAGVDVFFLISGFIMVFASKRMFGSLVGARDFMLRRLVRIVPPYWCATLAMLLLLALKREPLPSWDAIIATLAFIPYNTLGRSDGYALPILDLGWTLNYEMMFYVVFACFVPLGRFRGVVGTAAVMLVIILAGFLVPAYLTAPYFWTRGLILEFVLGMIVALAYSTGRISISRSGRVILVAVAVAYYLIDPVLMMGHAMTPNDTWRVLGWGLPATLLLIAAIGGRTSLDSRLGRSSLLLGDASYVLYLLHPFILIAMLQVFRRPILGTMDAATFIVVTIGLSCGLAIIIHLWIERPLVTWLTSKLQNQGLPIGAVPLP